MVRTMASAWRALLRLIGLGGKKEQEPKNNQKVRYHPYDEVSDDQLEEKRRRTPRSHPYDEISDDQLKEKPSDSKPPRVHPYDTVLDPEPQDKSPGDRPVPKMRIVAEKNGTPDASGGSELNYVEVDIQPGEGRDVSARAPRPLQEPTIYSEVLPAAAT